MRSSIAYRWSDVMLPIAILFVIFGSITAMVVSLRYMKHRERMAEIEAHKEEALARAKSIQALGPGREELARELLAAYDEVERSSSSE